MPRRPKRKHKFHRKFGGGGGTGGGLDSDGPAENSPGGNSGALQGMGGTASGAFQDAANKQEDLDL